MKPHLMIILMIVSFSLICTPSRSHSNKSGSSGRITVSNTTATAGIVTIIEVVELELDSVYILTFSEGSGEHNRPFVAKDTSESFHANFDKPRGGFVMINLYGYNLTTSEVIGEPIDTFYLSVERVGDFLKPITDFLITILIIIAFPSGAVIVGMKVAKK